MYADKGEAIRMGLDDERRAVLGLDHTGQKG